MHPRCALVATIFAALSFDAAFGQSPLGLGFTYQGRLRQNGQPFNGSANLVFKLFDAATGGNLLGTQTLNGVNVSAGLFTVLLDPNGEFGANAFNGQSRWLEVTANGTLLTPRQAVTATPYAEFAAAPWQTSGSNISYTAGNVGIGTVPSATLHVNGNVGVGVANIPAGLTAELGGTNTPILNLDMNFRHPNHNSSFVGGALRIDARNDGADPLFQFISRPAGSNTESIVAVLTEHGRLAVGGAQFFTAGSNLELNGTGGSEIIFNASQLSRHGQLLWTNQFILQNDFGNTGSAILNDDGSWTTQSDRRLKSDITPAAGLLAKALALRPVEFYMKNQDRARDPQRHIGLIAQDVQPVLPSLVSEPAVDPSDNSTTPMLSLNYSGLGVVAIGAIQEQEALITNQRQTIEQQQERLKTLEDQANAKDARINDLTARVEKLEGLVNRLAKEQPSQAPVTP